MREQMDMAGRLTLVLRDRAGRVALERTNRNRIVTSGRQLVADMLAGHTTGPPRNPVSAIAVGTGNTPPQDTDTGLVAQRGSPKAFSKVDSGAFTDPQGVGRVRVQMTSELDFGDANNPSVPLCEAGLFNPDGVLYSRVVFGDVTKTDTFRLTLIWELLV